MYQKHSSFNQRHPRTYYYLCELRNTLKSTFNKQKISIVYLRCTQFSLDFSNMKAESNHRLELLIQMETFYVVFNVVNFQTHKFVILFIFDDYMFTQVHNLF